MSTSPLFPAANFIIGSRSPSRSSPMLVTDQTNTKKLSAREILDELSSFRIRPEAIQPTSSGPGKRGGKAQVVQATLQRRFWQTKKQVAVKKLSYSKNIDKGRFFSEFAHEVKLMAGLSHKNIVQFVGFVEDLENGQAWIILSWEPNGNVSEFLGTGKWEIPERISLIQDAFEGLKHLHSRQPPICHGDLKSLNILVSASYRAIITDFGSARVVGESEDGGTVQGSPLPANSDPISEKDSTPIRVVATANQLTLTGPAWSLRWAPPEVVNGSLQGLASDIWSIGWVCWEIMTNKLPFAELHSESAITLKVAHGEVPSASEDKQLSQIARLCSLMTNCWAFDPRERPSVSQCCDEIKWVPSLPPLGRVQLDSKVETNQLVLQMGRMYFARARYEDAASLFQQVLRLATEEEKGQNESAAALYWLGNVSAAQHKYAEAEASYTRAQAMYARIGDDLGRANTLQGLGGVYHCQSNLSKAEASFSLAQVIFSKVGDDQGRANTLCGLGHIYQVQFNYERAQESFTQAQEIYNSIGDGQGLANALQGLGSVYRLQSKLAEAEERFNQARKIYTRIGDDVGRANSILGLGEICFARSEHTQAAENYKGAEVIYGRIGNEE
ncbi:hypothetical protein M407DRAFT_30732, partial [Tulasnella calospora MUT 4182]